MQRHVALDKKFLRGGVYPLPDPCYNGGKILGGDSMRAAQLTLDGYFNYGNILQKFALHHTLKKFADYTEVLWTDEIKFLPETGEVAGLPFVMQKERADCWRMYFIREGARQSRFKDFENLHLQTRFDIPYIEELADEYDYFVVGSDQVWNPTWFPPHTFLEFAPREKRIAYAASIVAPEIPAHLKEVFRRGISGFDHLSVREEGAIKIIRDLTGQTPLLMPDPVLLLTEDEWLAVAQPPTWLKSKYARGYVLTYYLRKSPPPEVKAHADKLNLPVINLLDLNNYNHFTIGPSEFIWLFAHASLVFTNSYHGVAFSILFKRPFLNREIENDSVGVNMSMRIPSLLKLFGLEDRTASDGNRKLDTILDVDFTRREEVLPVERTKAFKFLSEALGVKNILGDNLT